MSKNYKRRVVISILIILFVLNVFKINGFTESTNDEKNVYVIPIHGEINLATRNFVVGELNAIAKKDNVEAIIFEVDTYGGLIDKAIEIKDQIIDSEIRTVSYVNNKAESAGVLLTIASESVIMSESATIGSAETIPDTEKILSMWRAVLRDTAQQRGREELIIEAMADKDIIIPGLSDEGKLVNLTSKEALNLGISDFTSNNYDDILEHLEIEDANLIFRTEDFQVKLAKYISSPYISSTLLTIAFIGLVIEIFSPGFGLGGTISIIGFGLYFGGNILAGDSNWTSLMLFITGFILLVIEVIVPGFGLPGISGIILVIVGIVMAMESLGAAVFSISVALIVTFATVAILIKKGFKSQLLKNIILQTNIDQDMASSGSVYDKLVGKQIKTLTDFKPSGFIDLDGARTDALSESGYIEANVLVEIVKVEGRKIIVRRV